MPIQDHNSSDRRHVGGPQRLRFIDDMVAIEKSLDKAKDIYKLRNGNGNLISQVEMLRTLGAKGKKVLPGVDIELVS
jgi:hypothetical protein